MPPNWPDPPLWEHHLLESPWALAGTLVTVAILLFFGGQQAARRRVQLAALIPIALAVLVVILARAIDTTREQMLASTEALVRTAVTPFDLAGLETLAAEDVTLVTAGGETLASGDAATLVTGRAELVDRVRRASQRVTINSLRITNSKAVADSPDAGRVYVALMGEVRSPMGSGLGKTTWVMHWQRGTDGGPWLLKKAQWLTVNGQGVPTGYLP